MKKITKNPITFFREANEKRQAAVKNSLKKAQTGIIAGPKTESQTMMESLGPSNDPMAYGRGPRTTSLRQDINQEMRDMTTNKASNAMLNQMLQNAEKSERMKALTPSYQIDPATARMNQTAPGTGQTYKKGGNVKPSAGLSKKTKSNIAKKASAGKDIGKKGKGFAKVAAAAGGGEKGKRIAAAAMWKNIKRG
jgi:hypothetical protein